MLGPVVGGALLIWAGEIFALRGEYSQFLFGFLIVVVVLAAREGIVGTVYRLALRFAPAPSKPPGNKPSLNTSSLNAPPLRVPVTTEPQP
jgi:branched-chain amino acid transport system permease protein